MTVPDLADGEVRALVLIADGARVVVLDEYNAPMQRLLLEQLVFVTPWSNVLQLTLRGFALLEQLRANGTLERLGEIRTWTRNEKRKRRNSWRRRE